MAGIEMEITLSSSGSAPTIMGKGLRSLLATLLLWSPAAIPFEPPAFQGDVLDDAALLSPSEEALIATHIRQLREKADIWAAVYIADGLDGTTIEEAGNRLFRAWKLGKAGEDNGLLVLIVPSTRQVRIEVGYGLEGVITDAFCGQLIELIYRPAFRDGKFADGISRAFSAMAEERLGRRIPLASHAMPSKGQAVSMERFLPVFLVDLIPGLLLACIVAYGRVHGRSSHREELIAPILLFAILGVFFGLIIGSAETAAGSDDELHFALWVANLTLIGVFWIHLLAQSRRYLFASSYKRFLSLERLYRIRRRSDEKRMIFGQWFDPAKVSRTRGGSGSGTSSGSSSWSGSSSGSSSSSSGGGSSGGGGASGRW